MKKHLYNTHYFLYEIESDYNEYTDEFEEYEVLNENIVEKYIYILEEIVKQTGYDISKLQEKL